MLNGDDAAHDAQPIEMDKAGGSDSSDDAIRSLAQLQRCEVSDSSDDVLGCADRETSTRAAQPPARAKREVRPESQQAAGEGGTRTFSVSHEFLD